MTVWQCGFCNKSVDGSLEDHYAIDFNCPHDKIEMLRDTKVTLHYYITPDNINDVPLAETMKNYIIGGQDEQAISIVSRKNISEAWDVVATGKLASSKFEGDLSICEKLFEATNIGDLLSTKEAQDRIKASKACHTSMSVGDIVQIDSEFYLCIGCGFKKVTDLVTKTTDFVVLDEAQRIRKEVNQN